MVASRPLGGVGLSLVGLVGLDLASSKFKHASWKLKPRDFLDGKATLSAAQATEHKRRELGKWLDAEGLIKHAAIPEMMELEPEALHGLIKKSFNLNHASKVKEAEIEFAAADGVGNRIVNLLTTIETKLIRKAA